MPEPEIPIEITCTETQESPDWDEFLNKSPEASFYQLAGWQIINRKHFGHRTFMLSAKQNGKVVGVFPLVFINSKLFGKILSSMPFVNFGGPCAERPDIERSLLKYAESLTLELDCDYMEVRAKKLIDETLPTATNKISMTINLDSDPDVLWNNYASKHRTNIRRVYKNGLTVNSGGIELLDTFYSLLCHSWRDLGTPIYAKRYFREIFEQFDHKVRIFVCYQGKQPIATAFNGLYKGTVEGMWAAALSEARKLQPNYVLYWEMIKHACENGFQHFHLGRSSVDSGGEQFKKKWKAEQTQLYWQYYLNNSMDMPQLNVNNPKYQIAINLWRKLPVPVTTLIGPPLARNIP